MYQDLWVASDGIITVLFSDETSKAIYCYETDWNEEDCFKVRLPVVVASDGAIITPRWKPAYDPEIGAGQWLDSNGRNSIWLPDLSEEALAAVQENAPLELEKWAALARKKGTTLREEAILLENQSS